MSAPPPFTRARTRGKKRPTLRDVAELAGVSIKTASRVVNSEPGVSPQKVEAVQRAIQELDYRQHVGASSLRRADGRTAAVAALLEDLANPFSAGVHRALEDAARERNVLIFAGSVDENPEREHQLVRAFTSRGADALVIVPATNQHSYLEAEGMPDTPVVFVDRPPVGFKADCVMTDNREGSSRAVRHLIGHGHRRIGFLGDLTSIATARQRYDGYVGALTLGGLSIPHHYVVHNLHDQATAQAAVEQMMGLAEPPTALFAAQNNITVAAVRVLQQLGLERTVALVGFDDFPLADLMRPGITVVAQDPAAIGRQAAEILFARLGGDTSPPATTIVPTRLIERGSGELRPDA
jgi:LacI family transcriptional regulator